MSTTLTLTANKSAAVAKVWGDTNVHTGDVFDFPWYSDDSTYPDANYYIYLGFNAPSEAYKYRPILSAIFKCGAGKSLSYCQTFLKGLQQSFNEDSVNYSNQPAIDSTLQGSFHVGSYTTIEWNQTDLKPDGAALAAVYGLRLDCRVSRMSGASSAIARFASSRHAEKAPVIIATLGDSDVTAVVSPVSPAAGSFVNRAEKVSFMASVGNSAISFAALSAQSATLEYRTAGATAVTSKTAVVSSSGISYTAPANLFASGNYEYRFKIVDNLGRAAYSAWTAFTTADTTPVATPLSPDSSLEDGTQAITFRWTHSNESGSAQTKAELQKSSDGSAWTTLGTVTGAANEYAAPAGTFTSGTWYWRVRTYNLDGAAGEWSTALSFVVVAGPTKPVIVVKDASPRPLINWQTSEQSASQLQLDDIIDVTEYGSEKTWRCPVYLDDGAHTFRVRSQNSYGLWSEWGSATFTVSHTASGAVVLTVDADHRAELSWNYAGSWTEFVVYRDGVAIAKTTDYSYTDDYSVGTVRYQVRACASDGTYNYSLSNEVTVSVMPETVMLSALGSGNWLFLKLSTAQHRTNTVKASRTFSLTHLSGRKFPEAELTEFCDRSISVSYATDDEAEKAALEALMGSPVCLKTPGGKMVIGILDTLSETESMFYSSYNFAVSQMHYPEEVDLDA